MSPSLAALIGLALKAGLVLVATAAVAAAFRRRPAATRHFVWTVGLGATLLLPLLERVVPVVPVPVVRPALTASAPPRVLPSPSPLPAPLSAPGTAEQGRRPLDVPVAPAPSLASRARAALPSSAGGWAVLVWAMGAGLLLLRWLGGTVRLMAWSRRAALVTDPRWLGLAHDLARRLGMHRGVTLLRGDGPAVPMTWGVLRPVIWIPEEAEAWSEERRTVVLAHELAHVQRRDALTQGVAHLALAVHWFNPLAHVAARRLRVEREHACDDAVLALGTPGPAYADHLLAIVRALGERRGPALAFAMARRSQFEGRLLAVLDARALRHRPRRMHATVAAVAALVLLVPLAALRPAAERQATTRANRPSGPTAEQAAPPVPADTTEATVRELAARYGVSTALARRVALAAGREGVPVTVAFALVEAESGFRADLVSPRGAVGLTQLLPSTATAVAPGTARAALFDPDTNLRLGFRYLRRLLDRYDGHTDAAFAAYHVGFERLDAMRAATPGGSPNDASTAGPSTSDTPRDDGSLSALVQMIESDGERERLLRSAIAAEPLTDSREADVLAAARHIASPGDRARVYQVLVGQGLDAASRVRLLDELATLRSPSDVARVLGVYLGRYGLDAAAADAFCRAAEAMGSHGDHSNVLRTALGVPLSDAALARLLVSAGRIGSDGDKANVLMVAAPLVRPGPLRDRFLEAARTIQSDGDLSNVLAVLASASRAPAVPSETSGAESGQFDIHAHNVQLTPSGDGVEATEPGGYLELVETAAAGVRRVVITPGSGEPSYRYTVNGVSRPVDSAARAWIRAAIQRADRAGGI